MSTKFIAVIVTFAELDNYSPECYDAVEMPDGRFSLVPLKWCDQGSYEQYQYGCDDQES